MIIKEDGSRHPTVSENFIHGFFGEYRFLSNFHVCNITIDGIKYPSSEHAYMAAKTDDVHMKKLIADCKTPGVAKRLGTSIKLKDNWNELYRPIAMFQILIHKFSIPELREKLLDTENKYLEETNNWGDTYWGFDNNKGGHNMLGLTLMLVRDHYRSLV